MIERSSSLPRSLVVAVGLGLAFGGGMVLGKSPAPKPPESVEDPLARAEARTRAYEEKLKAAQLTWPQEVRAVDPALPAPPKVARASSPLKPLSEAPSSSPIVDKAVVSAPLPEPIPTAVVEKKEEEGEEDVVAAPDPARLDAAMRKVLGQEKQAPSPSAPPSSDKRYAVQLASTGTEAAANVLAADWRKRGQDVVVVAAEVPGKGTMYRVRVSGIASRAAADALKIKLGQGIVVLD